VNAPADIFGVRVVVSPFVPTEQVAVQRRRHRKKRIDKKWRKRYGVRHETRHRLLLIGGQAYAHPDQWKRMVAQMTNIGGVKP
jgi:hypothetical protein